MGRAAYARRGAPHKARVDRPAGGHSFAAGWKSHRPSPFAPGTPGRARNDLDRAECMARPLLDGRLNRARGGAHVRGDPEGRHVVLLKLSMTTLWMAGVVRGWTFFGLLHLLALAVVVLIFTEGTVVERRIAHAILGFHRH